MKNWNKFVAMGLTVAAVGSLAACTYEDQRLGAGTDQQGTEGASAVRGEGDLANLEAGRELNYYTDQFNRMGYSIFDANWDQNAVTYDLRKGDERQRVTLQLDEQGQAAQGQTQDMANRRVSDVEIREYRRMDQQAMQQDQEWTRIQQQVQNLQPGRQPHEYISQLSQYGVVEEFNFDRGADQAEIELSVLTGQGAQQQQQQQQRAAGTQEGQLDERILQVNMQVNPQTNRVTSIEVDENAWGL